MAQYTITTAQNIDELTNKTGSRSALPWTRSGSTITVTLANHGFAVGNTFQITTTSDSSAAPVGSEAVVAVLTVNTFTFTGANAGATSGTITIAAGDVYLINGGTLTVDQDTRYGLNNTTSCAIAALTISSSLGGTLDIDARAVRLIPYDTGSGTVPADGTSITQGGAAGELIGVYSALNVAPTAAGASMPASGYIKLKQVTGSYSSGALTGISANATGADVVGWIELIGLESGTLTANRLGTCRIRGDWYEIGTTSGSNATTYQIPTNGNSAFYFAGVWVETAAASGEYEFWPCAGSATATTANFATDTLRGRWCWISTTGLLRFQNDGTNSGGGALPGSGRKIRCPNVFTNNVAVTAITTNIIPNSTVATRFDMTTTGGGVIDINYANLNWYPSISQAYSVSMTHTGVLSQLSLAEVASAMTLTDVGIGQEAAVGQTGLSLSLCFAGGTITDCVATRAIAGANTGVCILTDVSDFDFVRCRFHAVTARSSNTANAFLATRASRCTTTDTTLGAARASLVTCVDFTMTDTIHYDPVVSTTLTTNSQYAITIGSACNGVVIDGLSFGGLEMVQAYSGLVNLDTTGATNIKIRNFGTAASPLTCGGARRTDQSWSRSGSTITVTTSVPHGLKTGDTISVVISPDVSAFTVAQRTVTVTGASTFTFVGVAAGASSGVLTYEPVCANYIVGGTTSAASSNVRLQRLYCAQTRTGIVTFDNSNKNILIEDVWGVDSQNFSVASLETITKKIRGVPTYASSVASYGTHWQDGYTTDNMPDMTALAWTRVTTTATVTSADHGLRTGDTIIVTETSDASAVARGTRTVTVLSSSTFTITATNAGAASGTIDVQQCNARQGVVMNESTSNTTDEITIDAGGAGFTSSGTFYMPTINDQATWTTPHYVLGYSGFPIIAPIMSGGTISNYHITYSIDKNDGGGYSSYKNLAYSRAGASGSNGASTFTVTDATGIAVDDYVFGTNVGPTAKVTAVDTGTNTVTVDRANIGTVSGTLTFCQLPNETVDPDDGFKIKVRIKTTTTNTSAIASLYWWVSSVATDRDAQYALDTNTYSITGLVSGSEVRAYQGTDPSTAVELGGIESSGTSFSFDHSAGGSDGYIIVHHLEYEPIYVPVSYEAADQELLVQPQFDRNYENP